MRGAWVAAAAAVEEEEEDEHEHEQQESFAVEPPVPVRLPDALGAALSDKATREEEEHDMATAQSRRLRCFRW